MTLPLYIWSIFHVIGLIFSISTSSEKSSFAFITSSWMIGAAMLYSHHEILFLLTNAAFIALIYFASFVKFGVEPPGPNDKETATTAVLGMTIRLAVVLACWLTA